MQFQAFSRGDSASKVESGNLRQNGFLHALPRTTTHLWKMPEIAFLHLQHALKYFFSHQKYFDSASKVKSGNLRQNGFYPLPYTHL